MTLNKEYPFNLSFILNIPDNLDVYEAPDKRGRRGVKLPRIAHRSFDFGKLTEIERMKHYDDRINEICDFKEKLAVKKSGHALSRNVTHIADSVDERCQRRILMKNSSKAQNLGRHPSSTLTSSH